MAAEGRTSETNQRLYGVSLLFFLGSILLSLRLCLEVIPGGAADRADLVAKQCLGLRLKLLCIVSYGCKIGRRSQVLH